MREKLQNLFWIAYYHLLKKRIVHINSRPMVTFSFDDAPVSALVCGAKILERHGFRGTFYMSSKLLGNTTEAGKITDLDLTLANFKRGHEIANHTHNHIDCVKHSSADICHEIISNNDIFGGVMTKHFAYPMGRHNARVRSLIKKRVATARGIEVGINKNKVDPLRLKAIKVYSKRGLDECFRFLSECAESGGWLIFYTHDVCSEPSDYGCRPEDFQKLVEMVKELGVDVATIAEASKILMVC